MISLVEVQETNKMIREMNLDVRTITMGISLMDCAHTDMRTFNQNVYDKITRSAEKLVKTGKIWKDNLGFLSLTNGFLSHPSLLPLVR